MPPTISGYLATGGKLSGALVQVVTVLASTLIYYPFLRAADTTALQAEEDEKTKV